MSGVCMKIVSAIMAAAIIFLTYDGIFCDAADMGHDELSVEKTEMDLAVSDTVISVSELCGKSDDSVISSEAGETFVTVGDSGYVEWGFRIDTEAEYCIEINYKSAQSGSGNMEMFLFIDGENPITTSSVINLPRTFARQSDDFAVNAAGNDIQPQLTELYEWNSETLHDYSGAYNTPYIFRLSEGTHTLKLQGNRGKVSISSIRIYSYTPDITYREYQESYSGKTDLSGSGNSVIIEAEKPDSQSSVTIMPDTDRSSSATYPQSARVLKLNIIGGSSWKNVGESLSWDFTVEKSGVYKIALRYMQDLSDGIFVNRRLYIDGEVPFAEADDLQFLYNDSWQCSYLGQGGEAFGFYLEEGGHTITLEAVTGDVAETLSTVSESLDSLNSIYRRIVMITGTSPDPNRDYNFEKLMPDELEQIKVISGNLQNAVDRIDKLAGTGGSYTSVIKKIIYQLEQIYEEPKTISKNLEQFKTGLGSLSSWLLTATEQPLKLDRIYISPFSADIPSTDSGFFSDFLFSLRCFIYSYVTDYSVIGGVSGNNRNLSVWIQSGRDQGEIIRELIDSEYAEENTASVELQIVATGTLLQSVLAGQAPDIVFDNAASEPVDYALRGAVYDISKFDDFNEIAGWFSEAALKPVEFNGGVYAMPQTFDYYMFFYRTDIFREYGYSVPETWSDLTKLIPAMQRNSHEIGIPHDLNTYTMLLYQNGGKLYKNGGEQTNLDSNTAVKTFVDFTELFTLYDLPVTFDFANRFRTGEMPCAIQCYSMYNQLTAFAPEIKGEWEMVPVPGTVDENGELNRVSIGNGTYIMLLETCKDKELAWDFMKWFMSSDIQSSYGIRMESVLGSCAKVPTANTEALSKMTWSSSEYKQMALQMTQLDAVPQVPGGYYLNRIITFAFNRVYNSSSTQNMGEEPSEVLGEYINEINEEIYRKRQEFGFEK